MRRILATPSLMLLAALCACSLPQCTTLGQENLDRQVTVRMVSGRVFTGRLDPLSDASELVLRWQRASIAIARPIEWDLVAEAHLAGQTLSGAEFRRVVETVRRASPKLVSQHGSPVLIEMRGTPSADSPPADAAAAESPPVQSLAIEAALARWDAYADPTGLLVQLQPLDAWGDVIPVDGSVEIDLIGLRTGAVRYEQPAIDLGRWTRSVRQADFGSRGAVYRLPFQAIVPEFAGDLGVLGTVHVRLTVPKHGTFEATQSAVRVRPFSPVRDQLQQSTGQRYFPAEQTRSGRH